MISTDTHLVYPFLYILPETDITSISAYNTDRNTGTAHLDCFLQTTAICRNCHKLISLALKEKETDVQKVV